MGKIKSKLVRRTVKELTKKEDLPFNQDFKENKRILGRTMPSKKIRNQIAGLMTITKKQEAIEKAKLNIKK